MKDAHNKAAEHHESAAKSRRAAAESHGKNDPPASLVRSLIGADVQPNWSERPTDVCMTTDDAAN
jgi:hypothetical protein